MQGWALNPELVMNCSRVCAQPHGVLHNPCGVWSSARARAHRSLRIRCLALWAPKKGMFWGGFPHLVTPLLPSLGLTPSPLS